MPIVSQFYAILIYIYKEVGGHHNNAPNMDIRSVVQVNKKTGN